VEIRALPGKRGELRLLLVAQKEDMTTWTFHTFHRKNTV
jgi:hypothetical protein